MDAFPAPTRFNRTRKVMVAIQVLGEDDALTEEGSSHVHEDDTIGVTPGILPNP